MKERNKPTKSFIARSIEEIEKEAFNEGYEAGKRETIEKACRWMEWIRRCGSYYGSCIAKESIRDFKKVMESSEESVLDYIKLED